MKSEGQSHSHTHTHTLTNSHTNSHTHSHTHSHSHTHTLTHTLTNSHTHSHSHTHTHTHTHTHVTPTSCRLFHIKHRLTNICIINTTLLTLYVTLTCFNPRRAIFRECDRYISTARSTKLILLRILHVVTHFVENSTCGNSFC